MTIDERIENILESDESVHESNERINRTLDKLTELVVGSAEAIGRLERIAGTLLITDEELDRRLAELEIRVSKKKPG